MEYLPATSEQEWTSGMMEDRKAEMLYLTCGPWKGWFAYTIREASGAWRVKYADDYPGTTERTCADAKGEIERRYQLLDLIPVVVVRFPGVMPLGVQPTVH